MKKGTTKKLISMLLVVLMLVTLAMPVTTSAATNYVIKTLNAGTWVGKSYNYSETGVHYTYYKITVPKAGELKFSHKGDEYDGIEIFNSKGDLVNYTTKNSRFYLSSTAKNKAIAVEKGTYYVNVSSGTWKYTFKAAVNKANYRMGKAVALKANTTVRIVQSPKMNYGRWYKINLTSKKKLVYTTNYGSGGSAYSSNANLIEIYTAGGKRIQTIQNGSDTKYCTKSKLAKGTYYILVKNDPKYPDDRTYAFGNVVTLKWK